MNKITLILLILNVTFANAQSSWKKINSGNSKAKTDLVLSKTTLSQFELYSLDVDSFTSEMANNKTIEVPVNGNLSNFSIQETTNFTNQLASKYGYIKSFSLQGIDDKTATGKVSFGVNGIHLIIFSGKHSTVYIDPYTKDKTTYIIYNKSNIENQPDELSCLLENNKTVIEKESTTDTAKKNANDSTLRTYRLALASTVEYSEFHINNQGIPDSASDTDKTAAVLSGMNTTMTRLNGVFEKEIGVHFNIILNSDGENELIFIDSDNFTNDNASILLDESQAVCDDIIGSDNYDIGHTFGTAGGGLAYLGVLCLNGFKGGGVTGSSTPIGDAFEIDLAAHEFGHQLGANHSYNSSCNNNRNDSTAAEPGSGSTIMGYAGICAPTNVQNSSDDYFHSISIDQMWSTIQSTSCAAETNTNNTAPVVNAGNDVSVPKSTPLALRGEATDEDSTSLTYCWEQTDLEIATMPPLNTNIGGPAFRSLPPTDSPDRYLPALSTVIAGNISTQWEVLPAVARDMNFSLVVRDNNPNGGASERDDMKITIIDTDPFIVTSPNTNVTWDAGTTETITWDKSTTDQAPINCANVRIKLSTDGGETFPFTLVESTPNDGSYNLIIPNQITSTARIMIEGIDNIFYNVNTTNFSIISSGPTFILSNIINDGSTTATVCSNNNAPSSVIYNVDVSYINDFSEEVTLSIDNLPDGVLATYSENIINDSAEITITLNNFENVDLGQYVLLLNGNSSSIDSTMELPTLNVYSDDFEEQTLSSPSNNTVNINSSGTTFEWNSTDINAVQFDIEIALDQSFNNIIISEQDLTTNTYIASELDRNTAHYWRVKPKNDCGDGDYSETYSFTTQGFEYCDSKFTETIGSEFISNVTINTIDNNSGDDNTSDTPDGYEDFTDINTSLAIGVNYPISVTLDPVGFNDHCYVFIDWDGDLNFNTTTERYDLGSYSGSETTTDSFEIIVPEDATLGETRMRVIIEYFSDTTTFGEGACDTDHNSEFGETEDYTINIINNFISIDVFDDVTLELGLDEGIIELIFDIPNTEETILRTFDLSGRLIQTNTYNNSPIDLSHLQSAIYILNIQNGDRQSSKKVFIK